MLYGGAYLVIAITFGLAGGIIFTLFGITIGAFKIAGGVLLGLNALDMVQARRSQQRETPAETAEGMEKSDIGIMPLGVPMLAGPGAISTVMVHSAGATTLIATAAFWLTFGTCVSGCVDQPVEPPEPQARIIASWDPLDCGEPHRVVVELEDDAGAPISGSVPCEVGGLTLDLRHWGIYRGRIYAWTLGLVIRSVLAVRLDVDAPVVAWTVATPR